MKVKEIKIKKIKNTPNNSKRNNKAQKIKQIKKHYVLQPILKPNSLHVPLFSGGSSGLQHLKTNNEKTQAQETPN